ncbi:MAG TPA: hypothetical protein VE377_20120 [Candidatus Dormibacteraeota bacterium]|nr:hypothetical protein [Candidatus Dormibacteraeota bacterium]
MQTLSTDTKKRSLLGGGLGMVTNNKRYIFWFWLLDLLLAYFGTSAFRETAHSMLDHSAYSDRLLHGFDLAVLIEFLAHPESGPMVTMTTPAVCLAIVFFLLTALFLPGVLQGYASTYRLPRDDFFRACGRNLWRFIRLMIIAGIVMGIVAGLLFTLNGALIDKAGESTNELLPFEVQVAGLFVIFLVMTTLRIGFDLAEADIVLSDQRAVRKAIAAGFRHTIRSLFRLLLSYCVATLFAAILLVGGLWCWIHFVPSDAVVRAFLMSQLILLLLLIPRFWQRGIAVSYWQQRMLVPVVAMQAIESAPVPEASVAPTPVPEPAPIIAGPTPPPEEAH